MAEKTSNPNPFENLDEQPSPEASTNPDPPPYAPPSTSPQETPIPSIPQQNKPIAIPAIGPSSDSPFLRAYAPILRDHQLPQESFLTFLDQLNTAVAASPPLQVLDATGGILNSVPILFPLHWIGSTISGIADVSSRGVSKNRTESTLRQANKDIFGPRGLKVEIAGLDALAHLAHIPILDSRGKVNRQAPLLRQLHIQDDESQELDGKQRQVQILQPWIAHLELNILPWTAKSKLTRFNAALKKRNGTGSGSQTEANQDTKAWNGLWLVIRDVRGSAN